MTIVREQSRVPQGRLSKFEVMVWFVSGDATVSNND